MLMTDIYAQRMTAEMDGEFVVFIIGLRINKWWKIHKWLPVMRAMPRMLEELKARPESGFLGHEQLIGCMIQYWRSFEQLERYARNRDARHWPAQLAFNSKVGYSSGDVGIWHETYLVGPGRYEAIYGGMRAFGLGKVGRLVPATGARESARGRISPPAAVSSV
jgi:hypothetical protein